MTNENQIDFTPTTFRGESTRYPMVLPDDADYSPRLTERSAAQAIQTILAQPAPVPSRDVETLRRQPETVSRERLQGDNIKSTPTERAMAALIRAIPVSLVMIFVGIIIAIITPLANEVMVATVLGVLATLIFYNHQEYRHSQAGVERLRTKHDHKLDITHERNRHSVEALHEQNRHVETMTAIRGDVEIKLKVLDLATSHRRLADRQRRFEGN